jgi:hypothetical protein
MLYHQANLYAVYIKNLLCSYYNNMVKGQKTNRWERPTNKRQHPAHNYINRDKLVSMQLNNGRCPSAMLANHNYMVFLSTDTHVIFLSNIFIKKSPSEVSFYLNLF